MFPRRYFAGRMFAPRFFPESAGEEPDVTQAGQRFCLDAFEGKRFALDASNANCRDD